MSTGKFLSYIDSALTELKIELDATKTEQIETLCQSMLTDPIYPSVSKIFDEEEIAKKHILDSLAPLTFDLPCWNAKKVVDLGTGGGFPSLPLAIALPEAKIHPVDSRRKSVEFVARMADKVGLKNIETIHSRAEELGRQADFREKCDLVVCRALSAVRVLLEYCLPLVKVGGYALFYKGPKLDEEMQEAKNALAQFGVSKNDYEFFKLSPPSLPFDRGYLLIHKKKPVAKKFPRKSGTPISKPL